MKKFYFLSPFSFIMTLAILFMIGGCQADKNEEKENDEYDGPELMAQFEIERTKDPALGRVPWDQFRIAKLETESARRTAGLAGRINALSWEERGPNTDATGPSNGNTRANAGVTAGRVRSAMVDSLDPAKKTVWVGGVDGGLWKTTDITATPALWTPVTDYLSNIAIAAICQDPRPGFQNIMYFCTGESYFNADAVQGVGVFKSTDGGATWNFLSSTSSYTFGTRILCDYQGNVYLATRGFGLLRSVNGGTSWTDITPASTGNRICDLEISSTSGPGRLHVVMGIGSAQTYRYADNPETVSTASGWNAPVTAFPAYSQRAEIAVLGNVLYALPSDNGGQTPNVYKSIDGGTNWAATPGAPPTTVSGSPFANTQGWYDLSVRINPANADECIIGGVDCAKTTNGGTSWVRISAWVGTSGQYVHADQHDIQWWDGGNKLVFACDGGIHFSADGGTTIRDRNVGLRLKQFYGVAIHPTTTNYFLCGAQDNGVHLLTNSGMGASVEVTGGDGGFTAIDQNEPQYQFGSYVNNRYRRSTNGGANWTSINFLLGTSGSPSDFGRFINPFEYDNTANILYAAANAGNLFRLTDPQSVISGTYYQTSPGWPATASLVALPGLNSGTISALHVSPFTANRLFLGTGSGRVVRVDNAEGASPVETVITPTGATGYVNCIVTGTSDQNLLAIYSNYGVNNVWLSNNGGTSWAAIDGNLLNMPVRWALFNPDDNNKIYIATEAGVWETDQANGASTIWSPNMTIPNVRVDMIKYRPSDRTIAAATHGRGLFTAIVPPLSGFSFGATTPASTTCPAPAVMNVTLPVVSNGGFTNPVTLAATAGVPSGTNISFGTNPVNPGSTSVVTLNNANTLAPGTYNITIQGTATGASTQTTTVTYTITASTPVISTQPANQTVCEGQNVTFSVLSSGSYQWQVSTNGGASWSNVSGQTTASYTINGVTAVLNNNQYRCVVSTICGTTNSNAAVLTVSSAATISGQPAGQTVCVGSAASFTVAASGSGLTYQWEASPAGCAGSFTNIAGATSATYTTAALTAGDNNSAYRCKITSSCGPTTITSNCAVATVVSPAMVSVHPINQTICSGASAAFSVTATGTGVVYQWQVNNGAGFANITNGALYSGATTATLTVSGATTLLNTYQYRCLVSNTTCAAASASNAATLTVNALPAITSSPASQTICAGYNTSFSVGATGTGLTYQWQMNTGSGFVNISNTGIYSGTNSVTLNVANVPVTVNGTQYQCVVSGTCTPPVTTAVATLTVHGPVVITGSPANVELCAGSNATFTVTGSSVPAINYQWQVSTNGGASWAEINGADASSYTVTGVIAVMNNNRYRCLLSSNTCSSPMASAAAILTVRVVPTVGLTVAPLTSLLPGQTTTLTANPSGTTGGTISTNWTLDNNPVTVAGNTYTATVNNLGAYQVGIRETWTSGLFCSALSPVVTLTADVSDRLFIFPSPNDGNFTVSYYNNGNAGAQRRIVVFDSKGARVFDKLFPISGPYTLIPVNLVQASRGIYYVSVGDATGKKLAEGKVHVW